MIISNLIRGAFVVALVAGCSSSNNGTSYTGGTSGSGGTGGGGGTSGTGGSTPTGGAPADASGAAADASDAAADASDAGAFMAVAPCNAATDYVTGAMVAFPVPANQLRYSPQCLKVTTGATVTFNGDFSMHPLRASKNRPNPDTPITSVDSGMSTGFTFTKPGFYAYYCAVHDPLDTGTLMSGVIWVTGP